MKKGLDKLAVVLCLFTGLVLSSCDDDLTRVGTSILPPEDKVTVYSDTFQMKASTIRLDSVYAKTTDCLLGEMYDPLYGTIKTDVFCQFYCEEGFKFAKTPYEGKVDSAELIIFYPYYTGSLGLFSYGGLTVYGDTTTSMQVTVYPVNKQLKKNFYTNDNPENYCDMQNPLGAVSYTAYDMTISDSLRTSDNFSPFIRVKLPADLGQKFYDETIRNPATFQSQSAFNKFFPGIYITNTYGSGCLIKTAGENISMRMFYNYAEQDAAGQDSLILAAQWFYGSKDVIQINRFINDNIDQLLVDNPAHTYIKSPAGVCTRLVLPTTEISRELDINDRFINGFTLNLKYLPEEEWNYAYSPPNYLLLLPEDSVTTFFEKGSVENSVTSFISYMATDGQNSYASSIKTPYGYSSYTRTYSFGNISTLLKTHIENSPDKDLSLLVLPVDRTYTYYEYSYYTSALFNSFNLSGVKIRTGEEDMKVVVLSSKFENKE
ncbi:MAG: DUF4270 domain-containing protein [Tannerella sp.]|jgi:hypothetical protein|nr:DUF4270 domain-containing protein [Tannerella sp.]